MVEHIQRAFLYAQNTKTDYQFYPIVGLDFRRFLFAAAWSAPSASHVDRRRVGRANPIDFERPAQLDDLSLAAF